MKLNKLFTTGFIVLSGLFAKAQDTELLLKVPYNFNTKEIIAEPTATYNLPGKVKGFTFVDLYKDGFYGQTDLTKELKNKSGKKINLRNRIIHNNQLHTKTGFGMNKNFSLFDNKFYFETSIIPVWFDNNGFSKRQTIDYFFNIDIKNGWSVNGFGEWQLQDKKINWVYGEFDVGKDIKKLRLSYSPIINKNKNSKGVNLNHRFALAYNFK